MSQRNEHHGPHVCAVSHLLITRCFATSKHTKEARECQRCFRVNQQLGGISLSGRFQLFSKLYYIFSSNFQRLKFSLTQSSIWEKVTGTKHKGGKISCL